MIIGPRVKDFICTTAHPKGCAANVERQIEYVKAKNAVFKDSNIKNALIIGSTAGYGLASAICATFGYKANVLGIGYANNAQRGRTANAGFYNTASFLEQAKIDGIWAKTIIGDAFSNQVKEKACEIISKDMGKIDLVIYSLAAPSRIHPDTGERIQSVLKPIGSDFISKTINVQNELIKTVELKPATQEEIQNTIAVMGGDDWSRWISILYENDLLSAEATTIAYSYIGPELTHAIYKDGTIGMAKMHLKNTADNLTKDYNGLKAYISVNKAVVTQASSAIPVVPLYISILFDIMKKNNTHEVCIQQITRMCERMNNALKLTDELGYIRMDDWEMNEDVQREVKRRWEMVDTDNLKNIADLDEYKKDFLQLFGFMVEGIDYDADVNEVASEEGIVMMM